MRLFQESCGYVTQKCDLVGGLSVESSLVYAANLSLGSKVAHYVKVARVKQVLADLALGQIANHSVESLTKAEYRRLMIGVQLVRDPVVLLLDEPTWDLDPLNTYFIISILANHAKKYNRIVMITMEKPRSDIFPFLDRVTYLCLGDVVYTGATRMMLDYFRSIGFPCPELENPLMYYLCLSTVDRRSRERFIESNNQISALVEKFKVEGGPYRKYAGPNIDIENMENHQKIPLTAYGRPGFLTVLMHLIQRTWSQLNLFRWEGFKTLYLKLLLMPSFFFLLWIFYFDAFQDTQYQRTFVTRNGLIFNCLAGAYFMAIISTSITFVSSRTRYYQEAREGIYSGPTFLLSQLLSSLPLSAFTTCLSAFIIFRGLREEMVCVTEDGLDSFCKPISSVTSSQIAEYVRDRDKTVHYENQYYPDFLFYWLSLWACYIYAEQVTMSIMLVIKSSYTSATISVYMFIIFLILGSGTVRSLSSMPELIYHLTYIVQPRYSGALLNSLEFYNKTSLVNLGWKNETEGREFQCNKDNFRLGGCRYVNGTHYLYEKYIQLPLHRVELDTMLDIYTNTAINFAFPGAVILVNMIWYLVPLPAFVKAKFRE